jgi:hypothetical protein
MGFGFTDSARVITARIWAAMPACGSSPNHLHVETAERPL